MIAPLLATIGLLVATTAGAPAQGAPGPAPASEAAGDAGVVLDFADHLLKSGEPYRAAGEYERFLFLCGGCERAAYARRMLAESYRRGGRPREAAVRFRAVAEAYPESPDGREAARAAAESLEEAGVPGEASDAYRAFASRWPGDPAAAESWDRALRTALRAHDADRVAATLALPAPAGAPVIDLAGLRDAVQTQHAPRRSPAVAGTLSALLPGAGYVYAGAYRDAVMAFVVNALFASGAWIAYDHEQYALAGMLAGLEIFWYGGNVVGAVNAADRFNARAEDRHWRGLERKWVPAAAATVSFRF